MAASISMEEFQGFQTQLLEVKQAKYESDEQRKRLQMELDKQKERAASLERELKKAQDLMARSKNAKDVATLQAENRNFKSLLEQTAREHKEQQAALRKNMKTIYESNAEMAAQLEAYKEREQKLTQREKDCQASEERLRSQQEDLAKHTQELQEQAQRALQEQQRQLDARIEELKKKEEALRSQEGKIKQHLLDSLVGGAEASSLDPFASTSSGQALWGDDDDSDVVPLTQNTEGSRPASTPQTPANTAPQPDTSVEQEGATTDSSDTTTATTPPDNEEEKTATGQEVEVKDEEVDTNDNEQPENLPVVEAVTELSPPSIQDGERAVTTEESSAGDGDDLQSAHQLPGIEQEQEKAEHEQETKDGQSDKKEEKEEVAVSPGEPSTGADQQQSVSRVTDTHAHDTETAAECETLRTKLEETHEQLQHLHSQLSMWQEKTKLKHNNYVRLQEEMKDLTQAHSNQIERLAKEKEDAVQTHLALQEQLHAAVNGHTQELEGLQEKINALETEKERLMTEHKTELAKLAKDKGEESSTAVSKLEEELRAGAAAHKKELEEAAMERKEEVEQWRVRLEQERGHWKEELSLIQEDRGIMITKLTEKDLALDELRERLGLQEADAQQQMLALKQALAAESGKVAEVLKDKTESLGRLKDKAREDQVAAQAAHQKLTDEMKTLKDEILAKVNALEAARTATAKLQEQLQEQQALLVQRDKQADAFQAQLKSLNESLAASHKQAQSLNESLEKAVEGRLDAEKQLHDTLAQHQDYDARVKTETDRLQALVASLEKQNADIEANLLAQTTAFRDERAQLEAAAGALRRDLEARATALTDLEAQLATLAIARADSEAAIQASQAQLQELRESLAAEKAQSEEALNEMRAEKESLFKELQELRQRFDDAELEKKIAERKSQQMMKELKNQLAKERAKQQPRGAGSAGITASPVPSPLPPRRLEASSGGGGSEPGTPTRPPALARTRSDLGTTVGVAVSGSGAVGTSYAGGEEGGAALVRRVAELQHLADSLQQQMGLLEQEKQQLAAKLQKKSEIIQRHLFTLKREGRATPLMEKDKAIRASKEGIMSSIFRSSSSREKTLAEEMTTTMSTLLEDTILKNIQLKTDIETLGDEVARLSAENGALLQRMGMRNSSAAASSPVLSVSSPSVPASLRHAPPSAAAAAGPGGGGGRLPGREAPTHHDDDDDQEAEAEP